MCIRITIIGALLVAWLLVACSPGGDVSPQAVEATIQTTGEDQRSGKDAARDVEMGHNPLSLYDGETSLEERIVKYPVVVRATLSSVTSEVIEVSGYADGLYAVVLKLHLTVGEYLSGSQCPARPP